MTTPAFWRATIERALRTAAQTLIAVLALDSTGLTDVDWGPGLALAGSAALLAVLTAIASAGVGPAGPWLTETPDLQAPVNVRLRLDKTALHDELTEAIGRARDEATGTARRDLPRDV
ncbi:holin [Kitasatospora sp. NPDC057015]|uniref:holin n=1 Tax=Kitasatospora sp. NPDC057015 TaxID=3346001 RepID=UPI0036385427